RLTGWQLHYATPDHTLVPWDGSLLELPVHGIWARRPGSEAWTCEFLLNETSDGVWVYRRDFRWPDRWTSSATSATACRSSVLRSSCSTSRRRRARRTRLTSRPWKECWMPRHVDG